MDVKTRILHLWNVTNTKHVILIISFIIVINCPSQLYTLSHSLSRNSIVIPKAHHSTQCVVVSLSYWNIVTLVVVAIAIVVHPDNPPTFLQERQPTIGVSMIHYLFRMDQFKLDSGNRNGWELKDGNFEIDGVRNASTTADVLLAIIIIPIQGILIHNAL